VASNASSYKLCHLQQVMSHLLNGKDLKISAPAGTASGASSSGNITFTT
jgi:hypothetical protein